MTETQTSAGADVQQAARHLAEGRNEQAVEILKQLVSSFPAYVTAHVLLARAYESAGRPHDALRAWHRAYFLMPDSPLIVRQRMRLLQSAAPTPVEEPAARPVFDQGDGSHTAPSPEATAPPPPPLPETASTDDPLADVAASEVPIAQEEDISLETSSFEATEEEQVAQPAAPEEPDYAEEVEILPPVAQQGQEEVAADDELAGWRVLDADEWGDGGRGDAPDSPFTAPPEDAWLDDEPEVDVEPPSQTGPERHGSPQAPLPEAADAWVDLDQNDDDSPADPFTTITDLDSLIEQLENAPPIRPGDAATGGQVVDDEDEDEIVTETLARIYEAQKQYHAAARAYEKLAVEQPSRAAEFRQRAEDLRRRSAQ